MRHKAFFQVIPVLMPLTDQMINQDHRRTAVFEMYVEIGEDRKKSGTKSDTKLTSVIL